MADTLPADRDETDGALEGQDEGGPSVAVGKHPALEHKLPLARVKRLIKAESDVAQLTAEAGALIAKATELFLEKFATQAARHMVEDSRVTLRYKDVSMTVKREETLRFLSDIAPEQVTAYSLASGQDSEGSDNESSDSETEGEQEHPDKLQKEERT